MSETILAALIAAAASIAVSVITQVLAHSKTMEEQRLQNSLQNERIDNLRREVEKHNNLVERMYKVEDRANRNDDEIKRINHRLEVIEKGA